MKPMPPSAPLASQEGVKHLHPAVTRMGSHPDPKEKQWCSEPTQSCGHPFPVCTAPSPPSARGSTWMNRLSWVFCCSSRVFSCSREKMYSAVCWRMAACGGSQGHVEAAQPDSEPGRSPAPTQHLYWSSLRAPHTAQPPVPPPSTAHPTHRPVPWPRLPAHLAELLPVRVRDEGFQRLEASIDALHPPSLVAVGDLPAYPPLLVPLGLRSQWDVGQAVRGAPR